MRRFLPSLILVAAAMAAAAAPSSAQDDAGGAGIDVVQVEGNIDPVVADLIVSAVADAERSGATAVVFQVDSAGALDTDPGVIESAVAGAAVPVAAWVGPAGSSARGAAAAIVALADVSAASTSTRIGPVLPRRLDGDDPESTEPAPPGAGEIARSRISGEEAVEGGVVDFVAPTLGDLIVGLDGRVADTADGKVELSTSRVRDTDDGPRRTVNQPVRFVKLDALAGVQHSLTSPAVAYLLLVVGLALMVFEFFTLGVGLAGVTGALALAGSAFGFSHLPVQWWAVVLILVSTFGFAVDVQAGHLGFWTGVGGVALLAGSLFLYGGSPLLDVALWLVAVVVGGQLLFMLGGMTVAVRNRCAVPTVGRDSMIGELGEARTDLNPEGVVLVRGAPWRARTRRNRKLAAGAGVRIVAVDRLLLEVEPEAEPDRT
ncbi:MAG: NfeD family protein [Acidimicrobiia bacterium]